MLYLPSFVGTFKFYVYIILYITIYRQIYTNMHSYFSFYHEKLYIKKTSKTFISHIFLCFQKIFKMRYQQSQLIIKGTSPLMPMEAIHSS